MGGSTGAVVGARFIKAAEMCLRERIPLVFLPPGWCAKPTRLVLPCKWRASAIIGANETQGIPYISVLADPSAWWYQPV